MGEYFKGYTEDAVKVENVKNLKLHVDPKFEKYIVHVEEVNSLPIPEEFKPKDYGPGVRYRFEFPNHYGASVIKIWGSYGYEDDLWELACLYDGNIVYTEDFCDVEANLTDEDVNALLSVIFAYEPKEETND